MFPTMNDCIRLDNRREHWKPVARTKLHGENKVESIIVWHGPWNRSETTSFTQLELASIIVRIRSATWWTKPVRDGPILTNQNWYAPSLDRSGEKEKGIPNRSWRLTGQPTVVLIYQNWRRANSYPNPTYHLETTKWHQLANLVHYSVNRTEPNSDPTEMNRNEPNWMEPTETNWTKLNWTNRTEPSPHYSTNQTVGRHHLKLTWEFLGPGYDAV